MPEQVQTYNFHTHTNRCGHAEYCTDLEILSNAKEVGITTIGFSEHIPNPPLILPDENSRMLSSELNDYLTSIQTLKDNNPDMKILTGFEAEYIPNRESYLCDIRENADYMILGQHFVQNGQTLVNADNNPNYPIEYASMLVKGIESGIFDIVAHPDYFMKYRDTIISKEDKKLFDENTILACTIICEKAKDMGIPIEINLRQAELNRYLSDGSLTYPHPIFWQIASETDGLQVVYGIDSHSSNSFKDISSTYLKIANISSLVRDKIIFDNYNPIQSRKNNPKLQDAYNNTKAKALSYNTHMVNQIMTMATNTLNNESIETIFQAVGRTINNIEENCKESAKQKEKGIEEELSQIQDKIILARKKATLIDAQLVLKNQLETIALLKECLKVALDYGCESKEEFTNIVSQLVEQNSSLDHKEKIKQNIESFKNHTNNSANSKNAVYQLKRNNQNSDGYINIAIVILLTIVLIFIGICVGIHFIK